MILASDYDNTLIEFLKKVQASDRDAICSFQKAGNYFGICSGRSIANIQSKMKLANLTVDFMIGNNGAIVVDGKGNVLYKQTISKIVSEQIFHFLDETCLCYAICDGYQYAYRGIGKKIMRHYLNPSPLSAKEMVETGTVVSFVVYLIRPKYKKTFVQLLQSNFPLSAYRNSYSLDIMASEVNKAIGCQVVEQYLKEKLYCIGDGENDVPMLKAFESFAVTRGKEVAKKNATHVVESVADAINYLTQKNSVL